MELLVLRVCSVLAIAAAYALFDVLNNRNVPGQFAYGTVAYGGALTLLYLNYYTILLSFGVALAVFGFGYFVYRIGQIGFGDVTEFVSLSLVLPFLAYPLNGVWQFNIPFIVSVLIATGVAALVFVPVVYIPRAGKLRHWKGTLFNKKTAIKAAAIAGAYTAFGITLAVMNVINIYSIVILGALGAGSFATVLFEQDITKSMIRYLKPSELEEEDMIAINMLSSSERRVLKRKFRHFGQLVTKKMLKEMRQQDVKLPVYRNGIPFAIPILVGVTLSILFGNVIILIL